MSGTLAQRGVVRWLAVALTAVIAVLGTVEPAHAQQDAYQQCLDRHADTAAAMELVSEGTADAEALGINIMDPQSISQESVEQVKAAHPDRFQEVLDHYDERGGVGALMGNINDGAQCLGSLPQNMAGNAVSEWWESPIGEFTQAVIEGNAEALSAVMTFWMDFSLGTETGPTVAEVEGQAQGVSNIFWVVILAAFVLNVTIIGARVAWTRRQGMGDGLEEAGQFLWTVAIYAVVVPAGIFGIVMASDLLSVAILQNFGPGDTTQFLDGTALDESMAGPVVMLALAGLSLLGSLTQLLALAARTLVLPLLVGLLPLMAGLTATEWGKSALSSARNWLIALVLFKPVAAVVYSAAWWIHNSGGQGLVWTIMRALIVALAGFSIIGVVKILVPALSAMGGGNSGAVGSAATGAVGVAGGAAGAMLGGGAAMAGKGARASGQRASGATASGGGGSGGGGASGAGGSRPGGGGPSGGGSGGGGGGPLPSSPETGATGAGSGGGSSPQPSPNAGASGASGASSSGGSTSSQPGSAATSGVAGTHGGVGGRGSGAVSTSESSGSAGSADGQSPATPGGSSAGAVSTSGAAGHRGQRPVGQARRNVGRAAEVLGGGGKVLGRATHSTGSTVGRGMHNTQTMLDDSLGSGGHPGQVRR